MSTLGNIIWIIFGGFLIAIEYVIASIALILTIIGIPFGLQTLKLTELALLPFGRKIVHNENSSGCISVVMNIIWFFVGGLPIALTHFAFGVLFFISIIGIPFGYQHFKLMKLAFSPFGKKIIQV